MKTIENGCLTPTNFVSPEILNRFLQYCPDTGSLVWKKRKQGKSKLGDEAGWQSKRSGKSYRRLCVNGVDLMAQNAIYIMLNGCLPDGVIDHIDGNGLNNKLSNLRVVPHSENCKNLRKSVRNKSGIVGVRWVSEHGRYRAQIRVAGKCVHLIQTKDKFEAICARKSAENKYNFHENHGESRPL